MSKLLKKTKFLSLYKTKQGFIYAQRRNINSTASLCFKKENDKILFLIRYQPLPEINTYKRNKWDDLFPCPITGSLEKGETPLQNAIKEVYEEANIKVSKKNLVASSMNVASTQMNETVFGFVFDVTDCKTVNKNQGDGSIFEQVSKNKWIDEDELKKLLLNSCSISLSSLSGLYLLFLHNFNKY